MLFIQNTVFMKSAAKLSQCPSDTGAEVALCGRSNAGKSSAINYITNQRKLARTSKTPGRTQLINFFSVPSSRQDPDSFRLVDLPGYGFARVPEKIKRDWHANIDNYLQHRQSLRGLVLVMDIRHPLKEFDLLMLDWSAQANVPVHLLLTKADKFKRGLQQSTLLQVKRKLDESVTIQTFSTLSRIGKDQLIDQMSSWIAEAE